MEKKIVIWNIANIVSLTRIILLFVVAYLLFQDIIARIIAFFLIILVFFMDFLDGFLARKLNMGSEFGGVFDITSDRIVENILWIVFSFLDLIPLWIPLLVITRGFLTDSIRSYALSKGMTAFGEKTMLKSVFGKLIVSSNLSRFAYAVLKCLSFMLLTVLIIIGDLPAYADIYGILSKITYFTVFVTIALCIIRAIPIIQYGGTLFTHNRKL